MKMKQKRQGHISNEGNKFASGKCDDITEIHSQLEAHHPVTGGSRKVSHPTCYPKSFFFFWLLRAARAAYGSVQARGRIRAAAAGLRHSHSNVGSEPHPQHTPQLVATPDSYPLSEAMDRTGIIMDPSLVYNPLSQLLQRHFRLWFLEMYSPPPPPFLRRSRKTLAFQKFSSSAELPEFLLSGQMGHVFPSCPLLSSPLPPATSLEFSACPNRWGSHDSNSSGQTFYSHSTQASSQLSVAKESCHL